MSDDRIKAQCEAFERAQRMNEEWRKSLPAQENDPGFVLCGQCGGRGIFAGHSCAACGGSGRFNYAFHQAPPRYAIRPHRLKKR